MRLIDADALIKEIDGIHQRHYANSSYQFIHDFFLAMFRRIRKAPTVEAVEVVRGTWETDTDYDGSPIRICSVCHNPAFILVEKEKYKEQALTPYCHHCGAKMYRRK